MSMDGTRDVEILKVSKHAQQGEWQKNILYGCSSAHSRDKNAKQQLYWLT